MFGYSQRQAKTEMRDHMYRICSFAIPLIRCWGSTLEIPVWLKLSKILTCGSQLLQVDISPAQSLQSQLLWGFQFAFAHIGQPTVQANLIWNPEHMTTDTDLHNMQWVRNSKPHIIDVQESQPASPAEKEPPDTAGTQAHIL